MATVNEILASAAPAAGTSKSFTFTAGASIGDCVALWLEHDTTGNLPAGPLSDSGGNAYTVVSTAGTSWGSTRKGQWFVCENLTAAIVANTTTITFTTVGSSNKEILGYQLTGIVAGSAAVDKSNHKDIQSTATPTTNSTGVLTQAVELALAAYGYDGTPSFTAPGGWSQTATTQLTVHGGLCSASTAYLLPNATTALNPQATLGASAVCGAAIITISFTDGGGATTVSGVGAIQSAEAFGTPDLLRVLADIGVASAEAFGKADVLFVLSPVAAASAETFGVANMVRVLAARAVASGEAFGLPHVVRLLYPLGIGSAEAIGRPTIVGGIQGPYTITGVGAIASREAFGNTDRLIRLLGPAGVVSGQAFGVAHVTRLLFPLGAVSAGAFGRPSLGPPPVVLLFVGGRADLNDGALYAVSLADGAVYQVLVSDVAVRDLLASDGL